MKSLAHLLVATLLAALFSVHAQEEKEQEQPDSVPSQYNLDLPEVDTSKEVTQEDLQQVTKTNSQGQVVQRYMIYIDEHGRQVKHGLYEEWYDSGQKARELTYVHDKPDGRQIWYHTNGKVWMEFSTKMGIRDGTYYENWRTGKRKATIIYRDGKIERRY